MSESALEKFKRQREEKLSKAVEEVKKEREMGKTEAEILGVEAKDIPEIEAPEVEDVVAEETTPMTKVEDLHTSAKLPPIKPGTLKVSRTWKDGARVTKEESEEEKIEVAQYLTTPANVGFACSMTKNMGNYESVKFDVSCHLPCYSEELDAAFAAAKKFVDMQLNKEVAALIEYRDEKKRRGGE